MIHCFILLLFCTVVVLYCCFCHCCCFLLLFSTKLCSPSGNSKRHKYHVNTSTYKEFYFNDLTRTGISSS
jgi:hypothetical protein